MSAVRNYLMANAFNLFKDYKASVNQICPYSDILYFIAYYFTLFAFQMYFEQILDLVEVK